MLVCTDCRVTTKHNGFSLDSQPWAKRLPKVRQEVKAHMLKRAHKQSVAERGQRVQKKLSTNDAVKRLALVTIYRGFLNKESYR